MSLCIAGGAGFVGASLARRYRQHYPNRRIVAFDNLSRRGSELNLADFRARNIEFIHGDVRFPRDLESLTGTFDLLIDAAAEPSVHADTNAIDTNLQGHSQLLGVGAPARWCLALPLHLASLFAARAAEFAPARGGDAL